MRHLVRALWIVGAISLVSFPAFAVPFEVFVQVQDEQDLYDLRDSDEIDDDTFDTLLETFQRGIDLNRATRDELYTLPNLTFIDVDRILAYRKEAGHITNPADLVAAGVLSQEKFDAISSFFLISTDRTQPAETSGMVRAQTRSSFRNRSANEPSDRYPPPMAAQLRLYTARNLRIGAVAILRRNSVRQVRYDPNRDALSARGPGAQFVLPKAYLHWDDENWGIIGGTYRIGFGQRLTFDRTDQIFPNGFYGDHEFRRDTDLTSKCKETAGELGESPCADEAGGVRVTPDYKWTDRLNGVAVGLKHLKLGDGYLQAYAFGSYQPKSILQTEIVDASICDDPRMDDDPACSSAQVFRRRNDLAEPTSRFTQQTLPKMYAEILGGGNVAYHFNERAHVGVTGYWATIDWLINGADLDFQEHSRTPFGGPFGAVGVDAAYGFGSQDFFAEVAHSFDSQPGDGGGVGAILKSVTTLETTEIEATARYYDKKFNNPMARPTSAADEFDGLRARDEAGLRLRTTSRFKKKYSLRVQADVWSNPSESSLEGEFFVRGDVDLHKKYTQSAWVLYRNKDFSSNGRAQCFDGEPRSDEDSEIEFCGGEKIRVATRGRYKPNRRLIFTAQYQHEWVDSQAYTVRFRQDIAGILTASAWLADKVRIRGRLRYDFDDINNNAREEHTLWTYLETSLKISDRDQLRARYDLRIFLDKRASTDLREPNPEHWLWLEYVSRF